MQEETELQQLTSEQEREDLDRLWAKFWQEIRDNNPENAPQRR